MREDPVDLVVGPTLATVFVRHRLLQHDRWAAESATSSIPSAFLIFSLAREKIVSIATTVRR